jgi:xanthine dehydrogenase accessory factor
MREILSHLAEALESNRPVLFCRLVATRGSTPQKAGASMLLTPDGGQIGTLGGGCVEAAVKQKAAGLIGKEGAEVSSYVLDHDPEWADGLICGGRMVVLAECPTGPGQLAYYSCYRRLLEAGRGFTEAISIDREKSGLAVGERFLFDHDGTPFASLSGSLPFPPVLEGIEPLASRPRPSEKGGVAYLPTMPRIRLLIVGAGHVGQAVAELASRADFEVWVVDDRPEYVTLERFPTARRRLVGPIETVLRGLEITPETFALIVTRGHGHDQDALALLAPKPASYVGMIGSKRKIKSIRENLLDAGIDEEALARVSAPVGLDIGSETVFEIAVSIVAELIARRNLPPVSR